LHLDADTGRITGTIDSKKECRYPIKLVAENSSGRAEKQFTIIVGETICLTPPLGWNSWNAWGHKVNQDNVLASARAMVEKGLARYGWTFINMDDTWQGERGGEFNAIQPNKKFPDMKKLCDDVHALGLKIGIYSTPWNTSYAGYVGGSSDNPEGHWKRGDKKGIGSFHFDENDARQWAAWGIDYLKYDWKPNDPPSIERMATALRHSGRDIVYSLSNSEPIENAKVVNTYANCWRTTNDLKDRWNEKGPNNNLRQNWEGHRHWLEQGCYGSPGHFPDADMLVVGDVVEKNAAEAPRPSRLTPDEQYTHVSLWSLWSCPLLIGCPIERMDAFTLNLLTNPEVLDIQQDARGIAGRTVRNEEDLEIIVKELSDGSRAIGLFNRNAEARVVVADWKTLGFSGPQRLRDVWRNKDIGTYEGSFSAKVRPHGVVLLRAQPCPPNP
jgi:alpha-galactosidase